MPDLPTSLTVPAAGALLGLGRGASYQAVKRGEIPVYRVGQRYRVPVAEFQALIRARSLAGLTPETREAITRPELMRLPEPEPASPLERALAYWREQAEMAAAAVAALEAQVAERVAERNEGSERQPRQG